MSKLNNRERKVVDIMDEKYDVLDFDDLVDEVYEYLSEFGGSTDEDYLVNYLLHSDLETEIATSIRDIISTIDYYKQVDEFDDGDGIELVVTISRDEFNLIETDEDGSMSIGVRLEFDLRDSNIEDVECDARYDFRVLIKEVS